MSPKATATVPSRTAPPNTTAPAAEGPPRVVVPADIDTADRIAWGLSFRQLAILAAGATPLWLAYTRFASRLPPVVWVGLAVVVAAVPIVVALGRREVTAIAADGTLTVDGASRTVIACGTTSIALRTPTEQAGLLEGFGQWLNALGGGVQIVVSAARHDLTPHADAVHDAADRLPHPALRAAAADHAAFLLDLDAAREPLHRQVLTVMPGGHAVEATTRALTALGITTTALDGGSVAAVLATAVDPYAPPVPGPRAVPGAPITAPTPATRRTT